LTHADATSLYERIFVIALTEQEKKIQEKRREKKIVVARNEKIVGFM
jgi:hypothetical protein